MNREVITAKEVAAFEQQLREEEKSEATVTKYVRDVSAFLMWMQASERELERGTVLAYKEMLIEQYAVTSANSMIAALNAFFRFYERPQLCIRQFKVQKKVFCPAEKELTREDYCRLIDTAERKGKIRLALVLQTICGTGIRVSELSYITVEAVRRGAVAVSCKGKTRTVFIVRALQRKLLRYAEENKLTAGVIFTSKEGKPINRCSVWREMKALCHDAGILSDKVFPHNLRHLFARTFYSVEKDIAKLADILGHSSINTTRIYIVTTGAEHLRRMEQMHLIL
ncbi:MAG: tyrosine-type recombinase/integrase [Clostridia bacterium]|nr:tyrosine-type recombinase/integrase [Clostridia bacterium]